MGILLNRRNFIMDDAISHHYSQSHQTGGYYKQMGRNYGQSVPLRKTPVEQYLKKSDGKSGNAGYSNYISLASQARKVRKEKRKYEDSDSSDEDLKAKKKKRNVKHKRNRIDDALGDDTY